MKKNNILFGLISLLCVGTAAGCGGGEPTYNIKTAIDNTEGGTIKGGGSFKQGELVTLSLYPTEGCNFDDAPPKVYFTPEGSETATENTAVKSSDGTYYVHQFTVNNGETGASTVGTYKASFFCKTNTIESLDQATSAKFTVYRKVLKDKNDASKGYHTIPEGKAEQKEVAYGTVLPASDNYMEGVDGKITWYVTDDKWGLTATEYDFKKGSVKSDLYLIGVVNDATARGIVDDAISAFKTNDKMVIEDSTGLSATVLNLKDIENKKFYFQLGNKFIIKDNNYYQINIAANAYYKFPLADPKAAVGYEGFKVTDIKEVLKYIELNNLTIDADDAATTDVDEGVSVKKSGTTDVVEKIEVLGSKISYNSTSKTFVYNELTYTVDTTNNKVMQGATEVGTLKDSVYIQFADNAGDKLKNKTYKIDGEHIKLVVETANCKVYQVKQSGKLYMELYITNGKVYKMIRYKADGTTQDFSAVIDHSGSNATSTSISNSNTYDMNLLELVTDEVKNPELSAELEKINASFESMLKNVTLEAKTLKTLIEENVQLRDVLKGYDYEILDGSDPIDVNKLFPVNSAASIKTLTINVKGRYSTIQNIINSLESGGYEITTSTTVFGDTPVEKSYTMAAGTNVLNVNLNDLPTGMNKIIAQTLVKLHTLKDDYSSFEYSVENEGTATEKNIYEFYANQNDSVAYLVVTLDKDGKLSEVTYTDLENANVNERNTYISEFVFPAA